MCRVGGPAFNAYAKYKVGAPLFAFLAKGGYDAACGAVPDLVENLMLQTEAYPPLQETRGRGTRLPSLNFQNAYTYDAASNRTSLTAPDGSITTYGYDTLNRLNGLANSWAGSFGFGYDALSRRTSLTRPNGVNTSYTYDGLSHLLSVLHQAGNTVLDGASYSYDSAGNRTSKTNYLNGATSNYSYDPLYELTQVTQGGSTTESYSYDAVGNRLSSSSVPNYNYNVSNELTSNSNGSYTYDANGNTLTDAQGRSFTWDFENRLTQAVVPGTGGGTTTFKYDPFGRRILKSGPLGTTNYLYDGMNGDANVIEEVDSSGNILGRYVHGKWADETLAEVRSGTASFYQADGLNSVTSLSGSTGTLSNTYAFDSFGNSTASTGTLTNPFQYTGREFDSETGLYYYRTRYYDRSAGRLLSEDPIGFTGGPNFYRYVANNPISWVDPFGLSPKGPGPSPAILVPSEHNLGNQLWGDVDPYCQEGRNIAADTTALETSIQTRLAEIGWYEEHNPGLAGDQGHWDRIDVELVALQRCYDECDKDKKPEPEPFVIPVPNVDPNTTKALTWGTALAGGAYLIGEYGWVLLF